MKSHNQLKSIRRLLALFIGCLFLSGLTAIPVEPQLNAVLHVLNTESKLHYFITAIRNGYVATARQYPFLLYGYDWLAFAHFVLAILFAGPYKDPVRNIWVIQFGLIACVLVVPYAFILGHFRGLPVWWRLVDCSFGIIGFAVLYPCYHTIKTSIRLQAVDNFFKHPYKETAAASTLF